MLELDEWDELLTNNFAANSFASDNTSQPNVNDADNDGPEPLISVAVDSSDRHPLRSPLVSSASYVGAATSTPSVTVADDSKGGTRPRLTRLITILSDTEEVTAPSPSDVTMAGEDIHDETIVHTVRPTDSFAGVALRYGISIAALRRANQLWPSDPIHLRSELMIPRGDTHGVRSRPAVSHKTAVAADSDLDVTSRSSSSDVLVSTFGAARTAVMSILPARMSLDSLSSRTSASEDHELEDLRRPRPAMDPPDAQYLQTRSTNDSHELAVLTTSLVRSYRSTPTPLPSLPCTLSDSPIHRGLNATPPANESHSRPTILRDPPHRIPVSVFVPVRTSQLEPEPAMELPARRPRG